MSRHVALVPAAGVGSRFGADCPKQYLPLAGHPLMWHTLSVLCAVPGIDEVALVLSPQDAWFDTFEWDLPRLSVHRVGGATRAESVARGLAALAVEADDWILVHDAARCCLTPHLVTRLMAAVEDDAVGGLLALPVADTVKQSSGAGRVAATVPRADLWLAQTPQMFRAGLLAEALSVPDADITDEASAIERLGHAPRLVEGDARNFKVTWPRDLVLARAIIDGK